MNEKVFINQTVKLTREYFHTRRALSTYYKKEKGFWARKASVDKR